MDFIGDSNKSGIDAIDEILIITFCIADPTILAPTLVASMIGNWKVNLFWKPF